MWERAIEAIFPSQCAACNLPGSGLCEACVPAREPLERTLEGLQMRALGRYEGALRRAVLALKDGRRDVAGSLGERLSGLVLPGSILVPVPTTAARRRARGIDGALLVARAAATHAGASVAGVLVQRAGDAQRGRSRAQRLEARHRFGISSAGQVAGRSVVLIDDVCTTGSTLLDCAASLRAANAVVERALVVAVAETDE